MIRLFDKPWPSVPIVAIDTETTGTRPGIDRAVQVGLVRFEAGKPVGEFEALVNPSIPIPESATAVHGITDDHVSGAPMIAEVFASDDVQRLLDGAQPAAYNATFDREMVPPFGSEPRWPWLDPLVLVRSVDRYERGKGRHQLGTACARHGIELNGAHSALADARAAGQLFYALAPKEYGDDLWLGDVLLQQRFKEAQQWYDFHEFKASQRLKACDAAILAR